MTDKELKRLGKGELLELLLEQSREMDRLRARVKELEEQLNDRTMLMKASGSLAEEALKLNKVFEAAQAAADQYLENVRHYASTLQKEGSSVISTEAKTASGETEQPSASQTDGCGSKETDEISGKASEEGGGA